MGMITTKDGTEIYYKDWGKGQPIVFHHGWPLSADDWDNQMMFFLAHGYRAIAHDRRGHGRSTQTFSGNEMDTYAADVAELVAALDLRNAIHVGHSTGGGEVARYVAQYGDGRVAKAVLISAVPPLMVKTAANPGGLPKDVFDGFQAQLVANRALLRRAGGTVLRLQPPFPAPSDRERNHAACFDGSVRQKRPPQRGGGRRRRSTGAELHRPRSLRR
jgi:non-heme chloroperoxidase